MTARQARDEGAAQTKRIVEAVKRLRRVRDWSAQQLADEMTKAGVPWNADIVVNLEHGRRKSLRVHEWLALMFVLDVDKPLDALVPGDELYPVVPGMLVDPEQVRGWLRGDQGPLRKALSSATVPQSVMESVAQLFEQQGRHDLAAEQRRIASLLADEGHGED